MILLLVHIHIHNSTEILGESSIFRFNSSLCNCIFQNFPCSDVKSQISPPELLHLKSSKGNWVEEEIGSIPPLPLLSIEPSLVDISRKISECTSAIREKSTAIATLAPMLALKLPSKVGAGGGMDDLNSKADTSENSNSLAQRMPIEIGPAATQSFLHAQDKLVSTETRSIHSRGSTRSAQSTGYQEVDNGESAEPHKHKLPYLFSHNGPDENYFLKETNKEASPFDEMASLRAIEIPKGKIYRKKLPYIKGVGKIQAPSNTPFSDPKRRGTLWQGKVSFVSWHLIHYSESSE